MELVVKVLSNSARVFYISVCLQKLFPNPLSTGFMLSLTNVDGLTVRQLEGPGCHMVV